MLTVGRVYRYVRDPGFWEGNERLFLVLHVDPVDGEYRCLTLHDDMYDSSGDWRGNAGDVFWCAPGSPMAFCSRLAC